MASDETAAFTGFTNETFDFFAAIRFNNNREFFQANRDWYLRAVREPARALAGALADAVRELDAALETRPEKVVSRINRDVRFSNDKSPYRDYIWLAFRRTGEERNSAMGLYFDLSDDGASYGMGIYNENRPLMNALRRRLTTDPEEMLALTQSAATRFTLHANAFKRMPIPDGLPEGLRPWYPLRGFYIERETADFDLLKSPDLARQIGEDFRFAAPLYRILRDLTPEEETDNA